MQLRVQELEAAINYWRERAPARGNDYALSREVTLLAPIYALMIFHGVVTLDSTTLDAGAQQLLQAWRAQHLSTYTDA